MNAPSRLFLATVIAMFSVAELQAQSFALDKIDATNYPELRATFQIVTPAGTPVADAEAADFLIIDNGVQVDPSDITIECIKDIDIQPICGMLALDNSRSMDGYMKDRDLGRIIDFVREAALRFIDRLDDNARWNIGALRFSDEIKILQMPDNRREILRSDIRAIQITEGIGTLFQQAILDQENGALFGLLRGCSGGKDGNKFIIFITDGGPSSTDEGVSGDIDPLEVLDPILSEDIKIYSITIDNVADENLAKVCIESGGLVFENVTSLEEIDNLFNLIRIREQLTVACQISWKAPFTCDYAQERNYSVRYLPYDIKNDGRYVSGEEGRPPVIDAGDDRVVCVGAELQMQAQGSEGEFLWEPATNLSDPTVANPIFTATPGQASYEYTVTLTDPNGCTVSDKVRVDIGQIEIDIVKDRIDICVGESVTLEIEDTGGNIQWSPAEGLNNPNSPFPVATPTKDTWYKCLLRSGPCSDVDSVFVRVHGTDLAINLDDEVTVCEGRSFTLNAQIEGAERIEWAPRDQFDNYQLQNPVLSPEETGMYMVRAFSSNDCEISAEIFVTVSPQPIADAGPDLVICPDGSTRIDASSSPGTYLWRPARGLDDPTSLTPTASPNVTTTYTLTVTGPGGCEVQDEVEVAVGNLATINMIENTAICFGASIELFAEAGVGQYSWSPATGLDDPRSPRPVATPTQTTEYTLTHESPDGCQSQGTVLITVNPLPRIDAGTDIATCLNSPVTLLADFDDPTAQVEWSPSTGLNVTQASEVIATPQATTVYRATITDAQGCINFDEVEVRVIPAADLEFALEARDAQNMLPGAEFELDVLALSDNLVAGDVREFTLVIQYNARIMAPRLDEIERDASLANWTIEIPEQSSGIITIEGMGPTALRQALIVTIPFDVYLPDSDVLQREITYDAQASSIPSTCIIPLFSSGQISFSHLCLTVSRGLLLSGETFSLQAPRPSPAASSFDLDFSIAFEVHTRIELYNTLGELVEVLADEPMKPGIYTRNIDVSGLGTGSYVLRMQAGPFSRTQNLMISN